MHIFMHICKLSFGVPSLTETMSGSRVPIANQIDQHLLDSNPTILDHVNDSFDLDYDAITLPFTKPSWKARWQRYCVSNENDVKKGRARASYIAGKSGGSENCAVRASCSYQRQRMLCRIDRQPRRQRSGG